MSQLKKNLKCFMSSVKTSKIYQFLFTPSSAYKTSGETTQQRPESLNFDIFHFYTKIFLLAKKYNEVAIICKYIHITPLLKPLHPILPITSLAIGSHETETYMNIFYHLNTLDSDQIRSWKKAAIFTKIRYFLCFLKMFLLFLPTPATFVKQISSFAHFIS